MDNHQTICPGCQALLRIVAAPGAHVFCPCCRRNLVIVEGPLVQGQRVVGFRDMGNYAKTSY